MGAGSSRGPGLTAVLASPWTRVAAFAALVGAVAALFLTLGGPDQASIERFVQDAGPAAPLLYVAVYVALTVLLFPGAVITAAGGALFGSVEGTVLTVVGATIGATAAFKLGRWLGRDQVERIAGKHIGRLDDWLERYGFVAVLYTRLIPVLPFNLLNYAVGATAVRTREYVIATAVGIVPGTFAYAELGHSLTACVAGERCDLTSPAFLIAVGLIMVLAVGAPFANRWLRARGSGAPQPADVTESDEATREKSF